MLSKKFGKVTFTRIDSLKEMLTGSEKNAGDGLQFQNHSIGAFAQDDSIWNLIFSNTYLQWASGHGVLFLTLLRKYSVRNNSSTTTLFIQPMNFRMRDITKVGNVYYNKVMNTIDALWHLRLFIALGGR